MDIKSSVIQKHEENAFIEPHLSRGIIKQSIGVAVIPESAKPGTRVRLIRVWSGWRLSRIHFHISENCSLNCRVGFIESANQKTAEDREYLDVYQKPKIIACDSKFVNFKVFKCPSEIENKVHEDLGIEYDPYLWFDLTLVLTKQPEVMCSIACSVDSVD